MKNFWHVFALAAGLGLGCGGETVKPINKSVGPEGGSVSSGDVTVTVPAGALDAPTEISIAPLSTLPEGAVGPMFELKPEGTTFKVPVQVTLPFHTEELKGLDPAAVVALTAPAGGTEFESIEGTLVDAEHIRVETTHFSQWVAGIRTGTKLVGGLDYADAIALDATNVYWMDEGSTTSTNKGRVMKVARTGGTPVVLAQDLEDPKRLVVSGGYVYFTTGGNKPATGARIAGTVGRVAVTGGTVTTLVNNLAFPRAIAVDTTSVYFSDYDTGTIAKVPLAGGAVTNVATAQGKVETMVVSSGYLYYTSADTGTVRRKILTSTTAPTTLATAQGKPLGIVVSGSYVYFTTQIGDNDGAIRRVALTGGTVTNIATSQARPNSIATDGTNLYWVNLGAAALMRKGISSGSPVVLVGFQSAPYAVAVDGTYAFWVNNGNVPNDGAVMRVAK